MPVSWIRALWLVFVALTASVMVMTGCGAGQGGEETEAAFVEEIERYRRQRIEDLRQPDSWLSLAGLYWLEDGDNTFGADSENDLVFPDKAPPRIGTFRLEDGVVHMEAAPGVEVWHGGKPVTAIEMDPGGETAAVILEWGSLSWHAIQRDHGVGIRLRDREHPALAAFDGIDVYAIDWAWRRDARFERYDPPKTVAVPTVLGTDAQVTVPGAAVFDVEGITYRLDVTGEPGDSTFFVIFGDQTNGTETYGGGRYLWVDAPDEDGRLVIDFNKAYNPPCVFTPYATCPLPPPQNRLRIRIEAGEKTYGMEAG